MDYNRILNKEQLSGSVINELKNIGIKHRKEKKPKQLQDKTGSRRIFRMPLHMLELTDVILANENVVQIPVFVADACNRILEQVGTEGIFRKAGSSIRQKEIRVLLESGMPLGKSHHVIDVANVIKYFFRELPQPLLPGAMQETLLRSLLIGENQIKAILLACLLLPPITLNTMRFFMQFLHTVSLNESSNKMTAENLAIIFTPGLMPFANINSHRFSNHLKVVQILIENANYIGIIPIHMANMLDPCLKMNLLEGDGPFSVSTTYSNCTDMTAKKKKKRRSGSLTHMFNGFKKIVGSAIGSSEDLDNIPNEKNINSDCITPHKKIMQTLFLETNTDLVTPCHKSNKKRKFADPVGAFSSKKKGDLLALLPSNSGGFLPNTPLTKGDLLALLPSNSGGFLPNAPLTKDKRKHRSSINGNSHIANQNLNTIVTSMERRWSLVGTGWPKQKNKNTTVKQHAESVFKTENPNSEFHRGKADDSLTKIVFNKISPTSYKNEKNTEDLKSISYKNCNDKNIITQASESRDQIEEALSTKLQLTQSMNKLNNSLPLTSTDPIGSSGLDGVQTRYERMLEETVSISLRVNTELAPRKSQDFKIRRSDQQDIRSSPSARKIGGIRRRSQEKPFLRHLSNTLITNKLLYVKELPQFDGQERKLFQNSFYAKSNLTRKRQSIGATSTKTKKDHKQQLNAEKWMSADSFFKTLVSTTADRKMEIFVSNHVNAKTPARRKTERDISKPPLSANESGTSNPGSDRTLSIAEPATTSRVPFVNRFVLATPIEDDSSGRASISRLRTLNAGMVMAKARLFDGMGNLSPSYNSNKDQRSESQTKYRDIVCPSRQYYTPKRTMPDDIEANIDTIGAQRKPIFRNTPSSRQSQGKNLNSTQRRQNSSLVRNANKALVQSTHKDKLNRQRNMKEMGISDSKSLVNISRHSDISSPRFIKRRKQRETSSYKSNHSDLTAQHHN